MIIRIIDDFDPDRIAENATINALTKLFGVGTKVANCVSLFGLHHVNAFPVDVWIRRVLDEQYPRGYPIEKYAPYNGIYQQYMFAYYREKMTSGVVCRKGIDYYNENHGQCLPGR